MMGAKIWMISLTIMFAACPICSPFSKALVRALHYLIFWMYKIRPITHNDNTNTDIQWWIVNVSVQQIRTGVFDNISALPLYPNPSHFHYVTQVILGELYITINASITRSQPCKKWKAIPRPITCLIRAPTHVAVNSLAPGRPGCHFKNAIFNLVLLIGIITLPKDNVLRWRSKGPHQW